MCTSVETGDIVDICETRQETLLQPKTEDHSAHYTKVLIVDVRHGRMVENCYEGFKGSYYNGPKLKSQKGRFQK